MIINFWGIVMLMNVQLILVIELSGVQFGLKSYA